MTTSKDNIWSLDAFGWDGDFQSFKMEGISPCWLNESKAIVDFGHVAAAPSKDFYHIFVTPTEVIYSTT